LKEFETDAPWLVEASKGASLEFKSRIDYSNRLLSRPSYCPKQVESCIQRYRKRITAPRWSPRLARLPFLSVFTQLFPLCD
jgi:hypothetical protein